MLTIRIETSAVLLICAVALLSVLLPTSSVYSADKLPQTILIIDGSGSMWGRIDKREKIVIARELLAKRISVLKGVRDLGVMSYGHRRRRDCRDIEMIVPPGPIEAERHAKAIMRLLPRGKTPVASALLQGAEALAVGDMASAHMLLVADGVENCRKDPCQTAVDLAKQYPGLKIDVIAFGVKDQDAQQLQCIPDATGGKLYKADDSLALDNAIQKVFANLTNAKQISKTGRKQKPAGPKGLYLSAALASHHKPMKEGLSWRIFKEGESSSKSSTPLERASTPTPLLQLPAGRYHVEARHGPLLAEQDVTLSADASTKLHLDFNAAILTTNARLDEASPLSNDVIFSLYSAASGPPSPRNIISHKQNKTAVFYLQPGKYALRARAGEIESLREFSLQAGDRKNMTALLMAGKVQLSASLHKDSPPLNDVQFTLFRREADKGQEFVRTLDPAPELILPEGDYLVLARKGSASGHMMFSVKAGENQKIKIHLKAGILSLSSSHDDPSGNQAPRIVYTIRAVGPSIPKTIKLTTDEQLVEANQSLPTRSFRNRFVLPEGVYLVSALYGNSNARASKKIQITAGKEKQELIPLSAGQVNLSLVVKAGDPPLPGVFWGVFDLSGKQIASASNSTPQLTLADGRYVIIADYLENNIRHEITLDKGEAKKVELTLQ